MPADLFHTEAWFENLLAHGFEQQPVHHVLTLSLDATGEPAAWLHLMQPSPGGALSALGNYYSGLYGPVERTPSAVARLSPEQWAESARSLRRMPGSAVLRLQPLDSAAEWLAGLEHGLRAIGYQTRHRPCFGNWYQPVPAGGFQAYWAERPSALRHSVERGQRRLTKSGPWRIDIMSDPGPALEASLTAYEQVYAQSWKKPEVCPGFMPGLIRTAAAEGWLRLGVLWQGGTPMAAQVWLVHENKANIYKLAYAKGCERLSAGSVLTAALMQRVMDTDHVQEVDFLSGDDAYKADWMAGRRERITLLAMDVWTVAGLRCAAEQVARQALRPLADRIRSRL